MSASSARPVPRPGILDSSAYVPGKSEAPGVAKVYKLSSNETPLGPSPKAVAAYRALADHLEAYPDGAASRLREAIAQRYGLDPARIVCGSGSDEILSLLAHAYVGPGDEGIFTTHGFLVYRINILGAGGTPVVAEETNFTADVDAILAKVTARTKIVFLANPNNPTGTYVSFEEVKRLHAALPAHVQKSIAHNTKWLAWVTEEITKLGLEVVPSVGNFVLIRFPKTSGRTAADADRFLTARGLVLRAVGAYGLPDCLRMTVGTEEANRLVVNALAEFVSHREKQRA